MNNGKRFEQNFKSSVPRDVFYYRFRDGSASWGGNSLVRFQASNVCDCMLFDSKRLYLFELKSIKGKSLPFTNIRDNQLKELCTYSYFTNLITGLVVEFSEIDRAFFVGIDKVIEFMRKEERKSIPLDFFENEGIEIEVTKKKVNRKFNIKRLLETI